MTGLLSTLLCFAVIAGMLGVGAYFVMLRDSATDVRVDPVCMSDCKSGCGCLRPRLQADGSWNMEFSNEDWRKE